MKDWTWPAVAAFGIIVAAIVVLFVFTDDASTRTHLIGYMDGIVPFVVGAAAGGVTGGALGLARARGTI